MINLSHLKPLSAIKTNSGVKFLTPAAFPGNHCPLHTALALSSNIKGMSTLVVGTQECGTYSRNVVDKSKHHKSGLHWTYVLDANEVVFGCRKGVIAALEQMDSAGAKAIMIILTCVPEVIGEDIEGIVHELQPKVKAHLLYVQMGHFKCNSFPSGFWKTLLAFGSLMEKKDIDFKRVNILGRSPDENHIPMPGILNTIEQKGLHLRMLAPKSEIEDFIAGPDACLNLVLSPYMLPLAQYMEKEFGVPFFSLYDVYSTNQIEILYQSISDRLNIDLGSFQQERKRIAFLESEARQLLLGLKYITTANCTLHPLSMALYLYELGAIPLLLHIEEFYPDDSKVATLLNNKGINPLVCHMVNEKSDAALIENISPDFLLGELFEGSRNIREIGFLYEFYGQCGYERTIKFLERMIAALCTTGGKVNGRL